MNGYVFAIIIAGVLMGYFSAVIGVKTEKTIVKVVSMLVLFLAFAVLLFVVPVLSGLYRIMP